MKNILIAKPSNDIYIKNRDDRSKTDLQSSEILAFIKAINYTALVTQPGFRSDAKIYLVNSFTTCMTNNIALATDSSLKSKLHNVSQQSWEGQAAIDEVKSNFTSKDVFFIFCGLWDLAKIQNIQIIEFAKHFPGKVYYVQNDLRLDMPDDLKPYVDKILTQATKNNEANGREYMALDFLPVFYIEQQMQVPHEYDIAVPFMNWTDMGEYRRRNILSLIRGYAREDIKRLIIGPKEQIVELHIQGSFIFQKGCTFLPTVKHNELVKTMRKSKASYIISEQIYIKNGLTPNRVMEALLSGVVPIVESNTLDSFNPDIISMFGGYFYYDHTCLSGSIDFNEVIDGRSLYEQQQLTARLHTDCEVRWKVLKYITDNFAKFVI
ncbi:hypothetical protein MA9V2_112 [Chryseobacterium phage MA9V-2]|nr:hypothetical protein MA9V2_112 [Chryseobacterium phage MA9V-2]